MSRPCLTCIALASVHFWLAGPALADEAPERPLHADLELDPTAYALDGFSLHAGIGLRALRLDLGVFGLRVPEFVHRQPDFEEDFDGYGLKLQYFPNTEQRGVFVGVDGAYSRAYVRLSGSQLAARDHQLVLGIHAGFRFDIAAGFYGTPWLGVGYAFGADDVALDGKTFSANPLVVFPALHLGYRLR